MLPAHSGHAGPMYVEVEVAASGATIKLAVRGDTPLQAFTLTLTLTLT